jgi:hypothetical protein
MTKEDRLFALAERLVTVVETHLSETRKRHEASNERTNAVIEAAVPMLVKLAFPNGVPSSPPPVESPPS